MGLEWYLGKLWGRIGWYNRATARIVRRLVLDVKKASDIFAYLF